MVVVVVRHNNRDEHVFSPPTCTHMCAFVAFTLIHSACAFTSALLGPHTCQRSNTVQSATLTNAMSCFPDALA